MRLNKFIFLIVLLLSLSFCLGCWDLVEITQRGSANAVFLDKSNDLNVIMGASFNIPGTLLPPYAGAEQQFAKRNYLTVASGRGILDAWKDLQRITSRQNFFGQLRVIVISEQFAKDDIRNMLDFFGRWPQLHGAVKLLLTHEDPVQLLDQHLKDNLLPGNYITDFLDASPKQTFANLLELWQVFTNLADGTTDVYMPVIQSNQGQYKIAGMALFSKYRHVGELDEEETQNLSLLRGYKDGYLTVPLGSNSLISFASVQARCKVKPRVDSKGELSFGITCNVSGSLRETIPETPELTLAKRREFEERAQVYLTQRVKKLLAKLQKLNSDPIGFGKKVKANYIDYWEKIDWHAVYPAAKMKVKVKFSNRDTGVLR
ncbi:MAG TPA: Ger(x)C family spore germination protein [Bacillota bacterium]|nr:Ger(x)C family spore germination protein [Bacillota bacterium]